MNKSQTSFACVAAIALIGLSIFIWKRQEWIDIPRERAPLLIYLKDPVSAQFRNERIMPSGALCGEVNAKNSMGGYVGFKKYIVHGEHSKYLEDAAPLGKSSTQDIITRLDMATKLLQTFNKYKKENPDYLIPSEQELQQMVNSNFFKHQWGEFCES